MRLRLRNGSPPELANIPFLKLGHLVRYRPQVCRDALDQMTVLHGKPKRVKRKAEHEGAS